MGLAVLDLLEFWNLVLLFILIHTLSLNVKQIAVMIASLQVRGCRLQPQRSISERFHASEICIHMVLCRWSQCQYSDMV